MSELLFDIFGDRSTKGATRTLPRQPLTNNENSGKLGSTGPIKPNEPPKKNEPQKKAGDTKKSFLSNTGKAFLDIQTPAKKVYSPRSRNIVSSTQKAVSTPVIYTDDMDEDAQTFYEELEFTRPAYYRNDNYYSEMMASVLGLEPKVLERPSPTKSDISLPDTNLCERSFDCSYQNDFLKDDFVTDYSSPFGEDDMPELYLP